MAGPRESLTTDGNILGEAEAIIFGDREETYGHPAVNLWRIAKMWSAYLGMEITARDVCQMQILLKAARDRHRPKRDNVVDQAGYAALIGRLGENIENS